MKNTWLLILPLVLFAQGSLAETRKFGIILGNNRGHDATRELRFAEQDARLLGLCAERGRAIVVGLNQTDRLTRRQLRLAVIMAP